jgi:RNA polymerase sigma-70 factor (ECF subfamily)
LPVRNDAELIDETLNGRPEAFEELVRRYQNRIFNMLLRLCRNPQDAEDLTQEVFIKVYDSLAEFEGKASFYTWLYRIAVNAYCSYCRHVGRRRTIKTVPLQAGLLEGERADMLPPSPELKPSETVENQETQEIIQAAIDSLDEDDKMVIVLRHVEGLEYHQIAEILDLPIGTVKSRLHRTRIELRRKLDGLLD